MRKRKREQRREMLAEYDFHSGVRGKYARRYRAGNNVVELSPEVAKVFPTSASVNEALLVMMKIARQRSKKVPA